MKKKIIENFFIKKHIQALILYIDKHFFKQSLWKKI